MTTPQAMSRRPSQRDRPGGSISWLWGHAAQVLTDPRDAGSLDILPAAAGTREVNGLQAVVEFDADRAVEMPQLPLVCTWTSPHRDQRRR